MQPLGTPGIYRSQNGSMAHAATPALRLIVDADPSRPFVIAQLGQSLDGRIATTTGESQYINGSSALDHLHALRAHVDAVVVGIGTVLADDPHLTVRRVSGRSPACIVVDPNGRLPDTARCLNGGERANLVVRSTVRAVPSGVDQIVVAADGKRGMAPSKIVDALFARGLRRILIEGGADTVSRFIDADCIDRLHVLVAPVIIGSGKPCLDLAPIGALDKALRPDSDVYLLDDGNVLFDCDLRSGRDAKGRA